MPATPQQTEAQAIQKPRRLKKPQYQRGKFQKRLKHPGPKLSSSFVLFRHALGTLRRDKLLFGGILVIYVLVSLMLVRGFSNVARLSSTKATLQASHESTLSIGSTLLGSVFSSSTPPAAVTSASTYQSILFIIMSLVIIYGLRQVYGKKVSPAPLKATFYKSTQQFIPFVLVMLVIGLQLIPLLVGVSLYAFVSNGGMIVGVLERAVCVGALVLFILWSLYMITTSLIALYIVTLPDVTPLQALRSAKELVRLRRWTVMRKIVMLPIILLLLTVVIMLPTVLLLTGIAEWVFFVLSLALLIVAHSYLYNLYRELL